MRTLAVVAAFVLLLAGTAFACNNEEESVRIQNKTAQTIVVFEDGMATELVSPGETKEFTTLRFRGILTYDIRYFCDQPTCDQTVLVNRTLTWDELKRMDGVTIVVP